MRRFRSVVGRLCILAALAACPAARGAVTLNTVQAIDFDRPESWAMKYFTSATLMNGLGTPRRLRFGSIRLALQGGWLPYVSDEQRVVGFNGTKAEDLNKLPVFGRLALTIGLPWSLSLTLAYVPPIPINGVQADLFSAALGRAFALTRHLTVGLSLYGQGGSTHGDFTCPQSAVDAGNDPQKNPFGCVARSHDEVDMNYLGFEVSASYRIDRARGLEPYYAASVNYMNLGFHVDALYGDTVDLTRLKTQGATFAMSVGALYPILPKLDVAAELFYTPLTVNRPQATEIEVEGLLTVRAMIAYRFN